MKRFDIEEYVFRNLPDARKSASGQIVGTCPWCDKPGRFYVDAKSGHYVCFKCETKGRRLVGFVAHTEGCSYAEARSYMLRRQVEFRRAETTASLLERIRELRCGDEAPDEAGPPDCPPPKGFIPVYHDGRWRHPQYLRRRGFQRETSRAWGLGWCRVGRYAGRVIIPVDCPGGRSFTARDTTGAQEPRYLNPPGVNHGKLLCGWNLAPVSGDVVLVEGPLDAMKMWQHGYPSLALMGKALHVDQLSLLYRKPSDAAVTILMDPEELEAPAAIAARLVAHFDHVSIATLPVGVDPGAATRIQADKAMAAATPYRGRIQQVFGALEKSKGWIKRAYGH